jgi:hypothetical protein
MSSPISNYYTVMPKTMKIEFVPNHWHQCSVHPGILVVCWQISCILGTEFPCLDCAPKTHAAMEKQWKERGPKLWQWAAIADLLEKHGEALRFCTYCDCGYRLGGATVCRHCGLSLTPQVLKCNICQKKFTSRDTSLQSCKTCSALPWSMQQHIKSTKKAGAKKKLISCPCRGCETRPKKEMLEWPPKPTMTITNSNTLAAEMATVAKLWAEAPPGELPTLPQEEIGIDWSDDEE